MASCEWRADNKFGTSFMKFVFSSIREINFLIFKKFDTSRRYFPRIFDPPNINILKNNFSKIFSYIPKTSQGYIRFTRKDLLFLKKTELRRKGKACQVVCLWVQDSLKKRELTRRPETLA